MTRYDRSCSTAIAGAACKRGVVLNFGCERELADLVGAGEVKMCGSGGLGRV